MLSTKTNYMTKYAINTKNKNIFLFCGFTIIALAGPEQVNIKAAERYAISVNKNLNNLC